MRQAKKEEIGEKRNPDRRKLSTPKLSTCTVQFPDGCSVFERPRSNLRTPCQQSNALKNGCFSRKLAVFFLPARALLLFRHQMLGTKPDLQEVDHEYLSRV
jgi:hypothetical protein